MISVEDIQAALISKIKANATIMALLSDSSEVREINWKGQNFTYPNIRVKINSAPFYRACYQNLDASIFVFSEQASSTEANDIAGTITNEYHNKSFSQSGVAFSHIIAEVIPAISVTMRSWRSEVQLKSVIYRLSP